MLDFRASKEATRSSLSSLRKPRSPRKTKSWHVPCPVPQCPSWATMTQATRAHKALLHMPAPLTRHNIIKFAGGYQHVSVAGVQSECSALKIPSTHSCTARGTWHHPTLHLVRLRELGLNVLVREPAGMGGETNAKIPSHVERAYDEGSPGATSSTCAP